MTYDVFECDVTESPTLKSMPRSSSSQSLDLSPSTIHQGTSFLDTTFKKHKQNNKQSSLSLTQKALLMGESENNTDYSEVSAVSKLNHVK